MKVCVIGTGHVGLVTCATFAALGHTVVGIDSDEEKVESLTQGRAPFFEPGLEDLVREQMAAGRLSFTTHMAEAVPGIEIVFICVGTPARADGEANLIAVEKAARSVAREANGPLVIVEKSTVPAGTANRVRRAITHERPELAGSIDVVSNPEFLREGKAVIDSLEPDRILVGAETEVARAKMEELYRPLTERGHRLIETDIQTAELAKHACNAFLALKISYVNALARMCERSGADVTAVAEVMGSDVRIGSQFLNAGLGYGGYCFPKDLLAFERLASRLGYEFPLLKEVARINEEAVEATLQKVQDVLWNLEDKTVALLGLAFKPETDDVRFSPALALARRLLDEGARVVGFDPEASQNAKAEVPDLEIAPDVYGCAQGAHCLVVSTDWDEFRTIDLDRVKRSMNYPVVVDARNLFDSETMRGAGFTYLPTGRPAVS